MASSASSSLARWAAAYFFDLSSIASSRSSASSSTVALLVGAAMPSNVGPYLALRPCDLHLDASTGVILSDRVDIVDRRRLKPKGSPGFPDLEERLPQYATDGQDVLLILCRCALELLPVTLSINDA